METCMVKNACTDFTKKETIAIAYIRFERGILNNPEKIVAGFRGGGILPVSFPQMQSWWRLFQNGGVDSTELLGWSMDYNTGGSKDLNIKLASHHT